MSAVLIRGKLGPRYTLHRMQYSKTQIQRIEGHVRVEADNGVVLSQAKGWDWAAGRWRC